MSVALLDSSSPSQEDHLSLSTFATTVRGEVLFNIFSWLKPEDFPIIAQLSKLYNQIVMHPEKYHQTIPSLNFRRWLTDKYFFEVSKDSQGEIVESLEKNLPLQSFSEEGKQTFTKQFINILGIEGLISKHFSDLNSSFYYENKLSNGDILKLLHFQMDKPLARIVKLAQTTTIKKMTHSNRNLQPHLWESSRKLKLY